MKIKKASAKDLKEIGKLMLEEFSKPPFNENVSLSSVLKSLNFYFKIGKILTMIDKKEIVGVAVFKIEQYWEGKVIIIEDLAVKEEYKKQGVGKKLMNEVESHAKKNNVTLIHFITNEKSLAIKFYKKLGYKQRKNGVLFDKKIKLS